MICPTDSTRPLKKVLSLFMFSLNAEVDGDGRSSAAVMVAVVCVVCVVKVEGDATVDVDSHVDGAGALLLRLELPGSCGKLLLPLKVFLHARMKAGSLNLLEYAFTRVLSGWALSTSWAASSSICRMSSGFTELNSLYNSCRKFIGSVAFALTRKSATGESTMAIVGADSFVGCRFVDWVEGSLIGRRVVFYL